MSERARSARAAGRDKAKRLTSMRDPKTKVDASDWSPPPAMNAGAKTGLRNVSARTYKAGGKVQGDRARKRADQAQRGKPTGEARGINRNVKAVNAELGHPFEGGLKKGGKVAKCGGGGMAKGGKVRTGNFTGGTRPVGDRIARASGGDARARREGVRTYAGLLKADREANPNYNKDAVNNSIRSSRSKIGGKEAAAIHRVLSAPSVGDAMRAMPKKQSDIEGEKRGGRAKHARGGRTKGKTQINIHIGGHGQQPPVQQSQAMPPRPMPPPQMTPPPMPPPNMPPPSMGGGLAAGLGGPPGGMMPPQGPPMMPRKRGGRAYPLDAGSGSGEGRLEKAASQARR